MSTAGPDQWIALLREGYEAFNEGDIERVLDRFGAGFTGHERPESPEARSFEGDRAALDALQTLHSEFEDYRFDPVAFEVRDRTVFVTLHQSGRGRISGVPVEGEIVHVWDIGPDDRASRLRAFSTMAEALEATGLEPPA